jgi:acyl transferase domain-containing protein
MPPPSKPAGSIPFEPIAIVGVGMRAPGHVDDFSSLWDVLTHRRPHATDPLFLRRFNPEDFEAMFSVTPDARKTLHGSLSEETPGLDEQYFGISKRDSACMDMQLKLCRTRGTRRCRILWCLRRRPSVYTLAQVPTIFSR